MGEDGACAGVAAGVGVVVLDEHFWCVLMVGYLRRKGCLQRVVFTKR